MDFGLRAVDPSLPSVLFHHPTWPARPPEGGEEDIQDGSHANPVEARGCSWQKSGRRKMKCTNGTPRLAEPCGSLCLHLYRDLFSSSFHIKPLCVVQWQTGQLEPWNFKGLRIRSQYSQYGDFSSGKKGLLVHSSSFRAGYQIKWVSHHAGAGKSHPQLDQISQCPWPVIIRFHDFSNKGHVKSDKVKLMLWEPSI